MTIEYRITLSDNHEFNYRVEIDRDYDPVIATDAPSWARLDHEKCSNCPLDRSSHRFCPAAVDLHRVIEDFRGLPAFQRADVHVLTAEREYHKEVSLETALRSLLGVLMATSACPVLCRLKPMARQHLPFASNQEFILRTVSLYLMRQYYHMREGRKADWELKGLVRMYQELQLVNQAFWQRIYATCEGDSNLKVFLSFFSMASSVSYSLEAQLQKIRPQVFGNSPDPSTSI